MDCKRKNLTSENVMCMKILLLNAIEREENKLSLINLIKTNIDCTIGNINNESFDIKLKNQESNDQKNVIYLLINSISQYIKNNLSLFYNIYDNSNDIIKENLNKNDIPLFLNLDLTKTLFYIIVLDEVTIKFSLV